MPGDAYAAPEGVDFDASRWPPRSRLLGIEPVGIGTPGAECLTSYIARLAWAHGLSPSELVTRVVAPELGAADAQLAERWARHLDAILRRPPTLNSHTPWTAMWVEALEALTLRAGLRGLTLLWWREVLPFKGLLRSVRAWCPACLADWAASGVPAHEPLLWQFSVVEACAGHGVPLETACPNPTCGRSAAVLTSGSRPGECPHCGARLEGPGRPGAVGEEELDWQRFVAHEIGTLVTVPGPGPGPDGLGTADAVYAAIGRTGHSLTAFAERTGVALSSVSLWKDGRRQPSLSSLLRVARAAGVGLVPLILGDPVEIAALPPLELGPVPFIPRSTEVHPRHDWDEIRRVLEACRATDPPASLAAAVRLAAVSEEYARRRDPALCHALAQRHADWLRTDRRRRRAAAEEAVRSAISAVRAEGLVPSRYRVQQRLPAGVSLRRPELFRLWQAEVRDPGTTE
jgi:transcriptional regulator with XRE-family HTH domain